MSAVIEMKGWREGKLAAVAEAPALECPTCEAECKPVNVAADGCTTYRCVGHGHRALTWRIDRDGNMLRGATGRRYY